MTGVQAFIGLGSNLEQPALQLSRAVDALTHESGIVVRQLSGFYTSAPVGDEYQGQPDYVNAVLEIETRLSAEHLLQLLLAIERRFGRSRDIAFAARTLDLDLLLYSDHVISVANLEVPHPRMHERAFVLEPLFEIAPHSHIPGRGAVADLREMCHHQRLTRMEVA